MLRDGLLDEAMAEQVYPTVAASEKDGVVPVPRMFLLTLWASPFPLAIGTSELAFDMILKACDVESRVAARDHLQMHTRFIAEGPLSVTDQADVTVFGH